MTRMAIMFDIPDDEEAEYAEVIREMIQRHAFAKGSHVGQWTFDVAMRPVGAVIAGGDEQFVTALAAARRELNQDHPWIPGLVFKIDDRLKGALINLIDLVIPASTD